MTRGFDYYLSHSPSVAVKGRGFRLKGKAATAWRFSIEEHSVLPSVAYTTQCIPYLRVETA